MIIFQTFWSVHSLNIQNMNRSNSFKVGAKFTGTNFAPDEYLNEQNAGLTLSFDGKRDRWNGYDPSTHEVLKVHC